VARWPHDPTIGTSISAATRPLRIVQMIDRLKRPGGAESLMVTLADALRHRPVKLTYVTIKPSDPEMVREIESLGAEVVPFTASKLVHPGRFASLCRFFVEQKVDLIHTHLTGATILGALASAWTKIPAVTTIHNTVFRADRHLYHGRIERWLLRHEGALSGSTPIQQCLFPTGLDNKALDRAD